MPGEVRTANWQGLENDDEAWKKFAEKNPMKRVATVEDVADALIPLVNDPHKFLNGNFLFVNGGSHLK
jgi:NAD(P)-dependent dehydrogenase (short-subunit alcohol dehydrogenase family)